MVLFRISDQKYPGIYHLSRSKDLAHIAGTHKPSLIDENEPAPCPLEQFFVR